MIFGWISMGSDSDNIDQIRFSFATHTYQIYTNTLKQFSFFFFGLLNKMFNSRNCDGSYGGVLSSILSHSYHHYTAFTFSACDPIAFFIASLSSAIILLWHRCDGITIFVQYNFSYEWNWYFRPYATRHVKLAWIKRVSLYVFERCVNRNGACKDFRERERMRAVLWINFYLLTKFLFTHLLFGLILSCVAKLCNQIRAFDWFFYTFLWFSITMLLELLDRNGV